MERSTISGERLAPYCTKLYSGFGIDRPDPILASVKGVTFGLVCWLALWRRRAFTTKQIDRGTYGLRLVWRIDSLRV
jgi:hypothetical protein